MSGVWHESFVEYAGAIYHVMSCWDHREPIFKDEEERKVFLKTLGEACGKTGWEVHAFCLMGNHFHMVVETPAANLVAGMKWILTIDFEVQFGWALSIGGRVGGAQSRGRGAGLLETPAVKGSVLDMCS